MKFMYRVANFIKRICYRRIEDLKGIIFCYCAKIKYKNRNIYIVAERGTDARDNGYHMFKYIRENHPEIEAYYIITGKSPDYEKVNKLGNVVIYRSWRHYMLFFAAQYKISTHIMGYSPDMMYYSIKNRKQRYQGKQIFLQHGVIKNNIPVLYQEKTKLDMFICGGYPEYKFISQEYHYKNGEVRYTGLARYDNLHNNVEKNQILIMPTWRTYLKTVSKTERVNSDYFITWSKLLRDERIIEEIRANDVQIVFYPHYEMQPYIAYFQSTVPEVKIADFKHYDVQMLLKESKLLITDYSSVLFDFAYMRKPCICYQFDKGMYHYGEDLEEMVLGEVVTEYEELVKLIIFYIQNDFKIKPTYYEKSVDFFPLYDTNNCKRIWEEIEGLK